MNPAISVVIPTHNRPDGLAKAVESVFRQTVLPAELIVVDDGSSPPVGKEVFSSAPDGLKTVLLRNDEPRGAPNARNRGIIEATSEWIAFLDDDDVFLPEKNEVVCMALSGNPQINFIYHPAEIHLVKEKIKYASRPRQLDHHADIIKRLLIRNEIGGTSMTVIRKKLLIQSGLFEVGMPALQDNELWLRCAKHDARFLMLDKPLTRYVYNTSKKSITFNVRARHDAMNFIRQRFAEDFKTLSLSERKMFEQRELRSNVFKAIINKQIWVALMYQIKVLLRTKSFRDLALLTSIPFGVWFVFKLRSVFH